MEVNFKLCFELVDKQLKSLNKLLIYVCDMHNSLNVLDWEGVRKIEVRLLRIWSKFGIGNRLLISQIGKFGLLEGEQLIGKLIENEVYISNKISRRNGVIIRILRSETPDIHLLNMELGNLTSDGVNEGRITLNELSKFISQKSI